MPNKILLIDGSNHAFRMFHAMPKMTAAGKHTGALLGFVNLLKKLENDHKPEAMIVVFDEGASFRVALYPEYKGHRPEMPPELREQWPRFRELVEAWGHPFLAIPGVEADDVIGTLAQRFASPDREVLMVTGDKDYYQLVREGVYVLDLKEDKVVDEAEVRRYFGVGPEQVIDILGLAGDASDNVPGVKGVGEKTAAGWVAKYGDLEGVIANAGAIGGKRGESVKAEAEMARLSRILVTIKIDCELPLTDAQLLSHTRDTEKLRALFLEWQFRSLLKQLGEEAPAAVGAVGETAAKTSAIDRSRYRTIDTIEALDRTIGELRRAVKAGARLAIDTETTSLDPLDAKLVGVCLAWAEDAAVYVPMNHSAGTQLSEDLVMSRLAGVLADPGVPKVGQNLKYDLRVLNHNGYRVEGLVNDTMLADYLLEPDRSRHNLDDLALRHLGHTMIPYSEATAGLPAGSTFADVPIAKATEYGAEDAHVTWLLDRSLNTELVERGLDRVMREIELPIVPVLAAMEQEGIGLDTERLAALGVELTARLATLEEEIYKHAGRRFTINSPKQLGEILFVELGLPPIKKLKTGYSTDADVLDQLQAMHPLPRAILDFRGLDKLRSTYIEALPKCVHPRTRRVHTSYHQAVAATGRLSSNDPNLQNIPVRTDEGRRIRGCFIPKPGHLFVSCDYSQVELRLLAHYCGEGSAMAEAFRRGEDIHRRTASEVLGVPLDQVTPAQRSAAKAINFGIVYGMSAFRLANDLRIPQHEAKAYMDGYFARYPEVRRTMDAAIQSAQTTGYAETLYGRRRPIADLSSRNARDRMAAERVAINTPIQGSAADIIKLAMARVFHRLRAEAPASKLLLQVHDELLLEVPEADVAMVAALVKAEMEGAVTLSVPLKVDTGWAHTWAEAH
ncbi:DNA polymerase I [Myxococcota bacterium]|nr:DNA polymerase I [Myxococcota bacterium]